MEKGRAGVVVLVAVAGLLGGCGGPTVSGSLVSGKQAFYNAGCDGLVFDARVSGDVAVLGVTEGETGSPVASFAFDLPSGELTRGDAILTDNAPPARGFMKGEDTVCFQFGVEDTSEHACFQSLVTNGAFCMKLAAE